MSYYVSLTATMALLLLLLLDHSSSYAGASSDSSSGSGSSDDGSVSLVREARQAPGTGHAGLRPGQPGASGGEAADLGANVSRILKSFFDHGYDRRVRPLYGGTPVQVLVSMHIVDISSVSEVLMDFTSDFYFRQVWVDDRLSFQPQKGIEELCVGAEVADKIWVPDTFFANEKSAYFHTATTANTFLRIKNNGEVLRSMRLTVTASCPMELQYFPMDRQTCKIEVESCECLLTFSLVLSSACAPAPAPAGVQQVDLSV